MIRLPPQKKKKKKKNESIRGHISVFGKAIGIVMDGRWSCFQLALSGYLDGNGSIHFMYCSEFKYLFSVSFGNPLFRSLFKTSSHKVVLMGLTPKSIHR